MADGKRSRTSTLMAVCMAIGAVVGAGLGLAFDNFAMGTTLSITFGVATGALWGEAVDPKRRTNDSRQ